MKTCCRCRETKSTKDFSKEKRNKDGFCRACKSCRKEIKKEYYSKNKERILNKQYSKRKEVALWVQQFKKKCELCEESHPACLDFHHLFDKEEGIANIVHRGCLSKEIKKFLIEEIKKCKVLCSNCHRKLHWAEKEIQRTSPHIIGGATRPLDRHKTGGI